MNPRMVAQAFRDLAAAIEAEPDQAKAIPQSGSELVDAKASGIGPKLFRRLVRTGDLQGSKVGRRYLVRRAEVDRWLAAQAVRPRAKALPVTTTAKAKGDAFDALIERELARGSLRIVKR